MPNLALIIHTHVYQQALSTCQLVQVLQVLDEQQQQQPEQPSRPHIRALLSCIFVLITSRTHPSKQQQHDQQQQMPPSTSCSDEQQLALLNRVLRASTDAVFDTALLDDASGTLDSITDFASMVLARILQPVHGSGIDSVLLSGLQQEALCSLQQRMQSIAIASRQSTQARRAQRQSNTAQFILCCIANYALERSTESPVAWNSGGHYQQLIDWLYANLLNLLNSNVWLIRSRALGCVMKLLSYVKAADSIQALSSKLQLLWQATGAKQHNADHLLQSLSITAQAVEFYLDECSGDIAMPVMHSARFWQFLQVCHTRTLCFNTTAQYSSYCIAGRTAAV
jgi:hypothetical protein